MIGPILAIALLALLPSVAATLLALNWAAVRTGRRRWAAHPAR